MVGIRFREPFGIGRTPNEAAVIEDFAQIREQWINLELVVHVRDHVDEVFGANGVPLA